MRKAKVVYKTWNRDSMEYDKTEYPITFLEFGTDSDSSDDVSCNYSIAIVETETGEVQMIRADRIVFLDKNENTNKTLETIPLILCGGTLVKAKDNKWNFNRDKFFIRALDEYENSFINSTIIAMGKLS